jgi:hypothetical protein
MLALISSTIFPPPVTNHRTLYRGTLAPEKRIEQTKETIRSLVDLGYKEIYLLDNSGVRWLEGTDAELSPARVFKFNHFQFENKGLSELYMLLAGVQLLPDNEPIFKISGRYVIGKREDETLFSRYDVLCRHDGNNMTTRAYYVKNRKVLESLLLLTLERMYSQGARVVGPKSLLKFLKNNFAPALEDRAYLEPEVMIEKSMFECIKKKYKYLSIGEIGLSGNFAYTEYGPKYVTE